MRAAMAGRESFDPMLWLRTSLTLLAIATSMLVAPLQTWGSVAAPPGPVCLQGDLAQGTVESATLSSVLLSSDAVLKEQALAPEDKDEDEDLRGDSALGESRISFLIHWCFCKATDLRLIAFRPVPSLYHLRC